MRIEAVAFSTNGCRTAMRLKDAFPEEDVRIHCKTKSDTLGVDLIEGPVSRWTQEMWDQTNAIVFIGALGIAIRYIAPCVKSKKTDPAIVGMDEHGKWAIALLSGHIGGCNELTQRIADRLGSEPIITTATDLNGKFSVDTFAARNGMRIMSMGIAKDVSAKVLDGSFVGFCSDIPIEGTFPNGIVEADSGEFGVCVSRDPKKKPFDVTLNLVPMDVTIGLGCKRDTDPEKLKAFVKRILAEDGIAPERVAAVASIDLKKDEAAIIETARMLRAPLTFYTADELNALEGVFSRSEFVNHITSVDCVCERSAVACGGKDFVRRKTPEDGMTIAICTKPFSARFL